MLIHWSVHVCQKYNKTKHSMSCKCGQPNKKQHKISTPAQWLAAERHLQTIFNVLLLLLLLQKYNLPKNPLKETVASVRQIGSH